MAKIHNGVFEHGEWKLIITSLGQVLPRADPVPASILVFGAGGRTHP